MSGLLLTPLFPLRPMWFRLVRNHISSCHFVISLYSELRIPGGARYTSDYSTALFESPKDVPDVI
jgi:hypothetical protein